MAGCAGAATQQPVPSDAEQVYGGTLNQCRTELALLKPLDPALYQQVHNVLFNQLLDKSTVAVSPGGKHQ
ncbi:hypothetical protein ACGGXQ_003220 [Salmonella enterica]|nr:hypothetical protein [Salmonella enterica]EJX4475862.1 hypothetical protein [Salmonella enterica]EKS4544295.1 hypothetical protein [Salmonella enterica]EKS4853636.1 hypothetical protein [Salmonella enterica]